MQCNAKWGKANERQGKAQALDLKTGGNSYMQCSGVEGAHWATKNGNKACEL